MKTYSKVGAALVAFSVSSPAYGAPARKRQSAPIVGLPNGPEIDNSDSTYAAVGPVGSSGDIYGSRSLLGAAGDGASAVSADGVTYPTGFTENQIGEFTLDLTQEESADLGLYLDLTNNPNPQPIRGFSGATDPSPRNEAIQRQNPYLLIRPGTDSGDLPNAKWPMGPPSNRPGTLQADGGRAGWARQQNTDELPVATDMASVDFRLAPNACRELHWHLANEWA